MIQDNVDSKSFEDQIRAIYNGELCTEKERFDCAIRIFPVDPLDRKAVQETLTHPENIAKLEKVCCRECKKILPQSIGEYTWYILKLRRLIKGGYPFSANDLDLEIWEDLGVAEEIIEDSRLALMLKVPRL